MMFLEGGNLRATWDFKKGILWVLACFVCIFVWKVCLPVAYDAFSTHLFLSSSNTEVLFWAVWIFCSVELTGPAKEMRKGNIPMTARKALIFLQDCTHVFKMRLWQPWSLASLVLFGTGSGDWHYVLLHHGTRVTLKKLSMAQRLCWGRKALPIVILCFASKGSDPHSSESQVWLTWKMSSFSGKSRAAAFILWAAVFLLNVFLNLGSQMLWCSGSCWTGQRNLGLNLSVLNPRIHWVSWSWLLSQLPYLQGLSSCHNLMCTMVE